MELILIAQTISVGVYYPQIVTGLSLIVALDYAGKDEPGGSVGEGGG